MKKQTCTINMNFTKSPQANCESSLEKGMGGDPAYCKSSPRPPPTPFHGPSPETGIFLFTLIVLICFIFILPPHPAGTWKHKVLCGQHAQH